MYSGADLTSSFALVTVAAILQHLKNSHFKMLQLIKSMLFKPVMLVGQVYLFFEENILHWPSFTLLNPGGKSL